MIQIPCVICQDLIPKKDAQRGRCTGCYATWESKRNKERTHYKGSWKRDSKKIRESHIRRYGPICTSCNKESDDLTVDHVSNRTEDGGLRVICRVCNSKKQ